jgi:hypothetical protein
MSEIDICETPVCKEDAPTPELPKKKRERDEDEEEEKVEEDQEEQSVDEKPVCCRKLEFEAEEELVAN